MDSIKSVYVLHKYYRKISKLIIQFLEIKLKCKFTLNKNTYASGQAYMRG
jgi:hypothetical protein